MKCEGLRRCILLLKHRAAGRLPAAGSEKSNNMDDSDRTVDRVDRIRASKLTLLLPWGGEEPSDAF